MGELLNIFIAEEKEAPLRSVSESRAVPGRGLEGDRYFLRQGTFFKPDRPDGEVTLVESESLEAMARESGTVLPAGQARRNLLTRGIRLEALIGCTFQVGEATLKGLRACPPCDHLERLTVAGVKLGLQGHGGLRAQVIRGGLLRTGDAIRVQEG